MIRGDKYSAEDIVEALKRRGWIPAVALWTVVLAAAFYARSLPSRYESTVTLQLVPAVVSDKYVASPVTAPLDARLPAIKETVLTSDRLGQIVKDLHLYEGEPGRSGDPASRIRKDLGLSVASSDSFVLTYTASNARMAQAVAERLGAAFIDENRRRSDAVASQTETFLDAQLDDARRRLEANEQALSEFNAHNAGSLPTELQSNLQLLQSAETQLQAVRDALTRDWDAAQSLDRQIEAVRTGAGDATTVAGSGAAADGSPAALLAQATRDLADLETHLQPDHPDILRLKRRIADLTAQVSSRVPDGHAATVATPPVVASPLHDAQLAQLRTARAALDGQMSGRQAEETRLQAQIAQYRQRIAATPGLEAAVTALMRDYDAVKKLYADLLEKREEAQVSANLQQNDIGEKFVIVSPATVPDRPASPARWQVVVAGAMFGLLLGFAVGALIEYRDTSVRSERELIAASGVPLLAAVPLIMSVSELRWRNSRYVLVWIATSIALIATAGVLWRLGLR